MAEFSVIDVARAPRPRTTPNSLVRRMVEYDGYVLSVKKGQVGKLTPGSGETARGVAYRVFRSGKRLGKAIDAWMLDDVVYFKVE
jgi:hypothetical protein